MCRLNSVAADRRRDALEHAGVFVFTALFFQIFDLERRARRLNRDRRLLPSDRWPYRR